MSTSDSGLSAMGATFKERAAWRAAHARKAVQAVDAENKAIDDADAEDKAMTGAERKTRRPASKKV